MSTVTFELPVGSVPDLPLREGMAFHGVVKGGKMHVTVDTEAEEPVEPPAMTEREKAAREFVKKWGGSLTMPTQEELDADPRLAYLIKKHVLGVPADELF